MIAGERRYLLRDAKPPGCREAAREEVDLVLVIGSRNGELHQLCKVARDQERQLI
jgi:hypothetical protein